jgi:hypothetical protein
MADPDRGRSPLEERDDLNAYADVKLRQDRSQTSVRRNSGVLCSCHVPATRRAREHPTSVSACGIARVEGKHEGQLRCRLSPFA